MNKRPIMFGDSNCPACLAQVKLLSDKFGSNGNNITYYDLNKYPPPNFIMDRSGSYSMPTWLLPDTRGNYKIYRGIQDKNLDKLISKSSNKVSRKTRFGDIATPNIDTLQKYGRNFDDYQGFKVPNSFLQEQRNTWGQGDDVLRSGTIGRDLGPDNTGELYSENYYSGIRMGGPPGGDYGTLLFNNRNANIVMNQSTSTLTPGLIYDTPNSPQVVSGSGFGRRRKGNRFGGSYLYNQMGPAYGSQYIMGPGTLNKIGAGGLQNNNPRAGYVNNNAIWIGSNTPPAYNPIGVVSEFGKRRRGGKKTPGPGSTLTIKHNKVKVS
jgi:hypothetical protein